MHHKKTANFKSCQANSAKKVGLHATGQSHRQSQEEISVSSQLQYYYQQFLSKSPEKDQAAGPKDGSRISHHEQQAYNSLATKP